ncbi:HNH endonuclease signature motif containing protein [uncultured Pseudacidovorax sp.]|uniref:HNH endonuclease signature motif containing protein n=1 Tax=uncultured Pseudacidovorax sp. TaxID=679313 RepID=UPI00344E9C5B
MSRLDAPTGLLFRGNEGRPVSDWDARCQSDLDVVAPECVDEALGHPCVESHHVVAKNKGGADTPENTAALCPNCHRELHCSANRLEACATQGDRSRPGN